MAEPWLLLPLIYATKKGGVYAEYGHETAGRAIASFLERLPEGRTDYFREVGGLARSLYRRIAPPGTRFFLDKTPRYGLIAAELRIAFPNAKFILLHRNPLAVVSSIMSTWHDGAWKVHFHHNDLFLLARKLIEAQREAPDAYLRVRYEDLVSDPEQTIAKVIDHLGLVWEDDPLTRFSELTLGSVVGDQTGVHEYARISEAPLNKWKDVLASPVRRRWARRYLEWLGPSHLEAMGYDMDELLLELTRTRRGYRRAPIDVLNNAKGVVSLLAEPERIRRKISRLRSLGDMVNYTCRLALKPPFDVRLSQQRLTSGHMLVSHDHRFIFLHIPKTGGTSVRELFVPYARLKDRLAYEYSVSRRAYGVVLRLMGWTDDGMRQFTGLHTHEKAHSAREKLGAEVFDSYFKFAFTRNPYDLLVSLYFYIRDSSWHKHHGAVMRMSFSEFAIWYAQANQPRQVDFLCSPDSGVVMVDYVGHLESLEQDLIHIASHLRLPSLGGVRRLNITETRGQRDYQTFYDDETTETVAEYFKPDFLALGYDLDGRLSSPSSGDG